MLRPKLIYLARRNPSLDHDGFVARWRQHGALGMSMPRWKNIWRYAHCDTLSMDERAQGIAKGYDGVGLVWHRSPDSRLAHRTDVSSQAVMEADELATFAEPVVNFCALYEGQIVVDDGISERPVKLIRFLRCRPDFPAAEFASEWAKLCAEQLLNVPGIRPRLRRYVQNHRAPPEGQASWALPYDCVEELWFDDLDSALAAQAAIIGFAPLKVALDRAVADMITVATNEVLLYEAPAAP